MSSPRESNKQCAATTSLRSSSETPPATGRKIDIDVLDLFQIRDGRLVAHWALLDNPGMLAQLGAA